MADVVVQGARGRARVRRDLFVLGGLACGTALLYGGPAWALSKTCLTGKDPSVVNDAAQIRTLRATIETSCACTDFDGSGKGKSHGDYVKCAGDIINAATDAGHLRKQCKGTVKKFYSQSACGFKASLAKVPCVKSKSGKVTCTIKPTTACDGKPGQLVCNAWPDCVDASDTNADLVIGAGPAGQDSGDCACPPGVGNCNGQDADGCETNVASSADNCGFCGHICRAPSGAGAAAACVNSVCSGQCPAGQTLCEATIDGGGGCAAGDCPQLTELIGDATSGTPYLDICPNAQALGGITFALEDGHFSQIGGGCRGFSLTSDSALPVRGGSARSTQTLQCPTIGKAQGCTVTAGLPNIAVHCDLVGYSAVGFQASSDAANVTQLSLRCAPVSLGFRILGGTFTDATIQVTGIALGTPITTAPAGPGGGTASSVIDCPSGTGANAIYTNAGVGVNAVGLGCSPLPVGKIFRGPLACF